MLLALRACEHCGRKSFYYSNSIPDVKILDNYGWTLINASEVMLELNLSQLQHHPDACDAMLAPASYFEPTLRIATMPIICSNICWKYLLSIKITDIYNYGFYYCVLLYISTIITLLHVNSCVEGYQKGLSSH